MPDSQSSEPGFELPFRSLGIFILSTMPQFNYLYLATDNGGDVSE